MNLFSVFSLYRKLCWFALLASFSMPLVAQTTNLPTVISQLLAEHLDEENNYGSLSIGVFFDGQPQYYFHGTIDSDTALIAPNEHTLYRIGSISKVITNTLYHALVKNKTVSPQQSIGSLLPDTLTQQNPVLNTISLHQLATHTAGFPNKPFNIVQTIIDKDNPYANYSLEDMYHYLSTFHPLIVDNKPAPSNFQYSHFGIGLLAHLLETATQQSYTQLIEQYVSRPLQCHDLCLLPNDEQQMRTVEGHNFAGRPTETIDFLSLYGSEGLWASLDDMMKFVYANIEGSIDYLRSTQEAYYPTQMKHVKTCAGWYAIDRNKNVPTIYTHSGRIGGYSNYIGFIPEWNMGVIIMSNTTQRVDNIGIELLSNLVLKHRWQAKKDK
ncbi:MAG: beta-lactamase family protein [Chitinophagales bacterium]|nr:beta-lactamase family protein [Chitinophagales bacterium]